MSGYAGERYSVVWYVNKEEHATCQAFDVDECWAPSGRVVPRDVGAKGSLRVDQETTAVGAGGGVAVGVEAVEAGRDEEDLGALAELGDGASDDGEEEEEEEEEAPVVLVRPVL